MRKFGVMAAVVVASVAVSAPANAAGCNGVVNPFVWGCAPWDNNNGPNYPYFKKVEVRVPVAQGRVVNENGGRFVIDTRSGQKFPLIGNDRSTLVGARNAN